MKLFFEYRTKSEPIEADHYGLNYLSELTFKTMEEALILGSKIKFKKFVFANIENSGDHRLMPIIDSSSEIILIYYDAAGKELKRQKITSKCTAKLANEDLPSVTANGAILIDEQTNKLVPYEFVITLDKLDKLKSKIKTAARNYFKDVNTSTQKVVLKEVYIASIEKRYYDFLILDRPIEEYTKQDLLKNDSPKQLIIRSWEEIKKVIKDTDYYSRNTGFDRWSHYHEYNYSPSVKKICSLLLNCYKSIESKVPDKFKDTYNINVKELNRLLNEKESDRYSYGEYTKYSCYYFKNFCLKALGLELKD